MADVLVLNKSRSALHGGGADATERRKEFAGLGGHYVAIPLDLNGAEHSKWRKLLDPVFAPKKVAPLEPRIRERANELLDQIQGRGRADVYDEWCEPLPSSVFLSIMGIPTSELDHLPRPSPASSSTSLAIRSIVEPSWTSPACGRRRSRS